MKTIAVVNQEIINDTNLRELQGQTTINDICLDSEGNLAILRDLEATMNIAKCVVRVNTGELQYNQNKGVPYFQTIYQDKSLLYLWTSYLFLAIENIQDVKSIEEFEYSYDEESSTLSYVLSLNTVYGEGKLNERFI